MSAAGRGAVRQTDDFYETPGWLTRAILPHLNLTPQSYAFEPACGQGAIVQELLNFGLPESHVFCADINPAFVSQVSTRLKVNVVQSNFLQKFLPTFQATENRPDLIITNPPYKHALEFVKESLEIVDIYGTVAMLLRLNFLGGQKRAKFLREHPCDVYVSPRRPSFTGGSTDATEYAWFVWRPSRQHRVFILDTENR